MRSDALGMFWEDTPVVKIKKEPPPKRTPPEPLWLKPDYLPNLEEAKAFRVDLMTDAEIVAATGSKMIFDVECYPNYFMVGFRHMQTKKVVLFELSAELGLSMDLPKLRWMLHNFCIIGFNSWNYDLPILAVACAGADNAKLSRATERLIVEEARPADVLRSYKAKAFKEINHIDLIEVAPLQASLKSYAGRLHCQRMQDLPFPPGTQLTPDQVSITRWYNVNDLVNTQLLHDALIEQLDLRTQLSSEYNIDLRSRSDAQIAESVISEEMRRMTGAHIHKPEIPVGTLYRYRVPAFLRFQTPLLNQVLATVANAPFIVDETGSIANPQALQDLKFTIGGSTYKMGIGGLHSTESKIQHVATDDVLLKDIDASSFYPYIILNLGLYPQHLGPAFLMIYRNIVERRIAAKNNAKKAKEAKDKDAEIRWKVIADSLKITINGSFGKLGNMYSVMYAPDLLVQTTLTGQLSLFMLIEAFELCGISVVSANTDGIVIKCQKHLESLAQQCVKWWEQVTGFETEDANYRRINISSVNNYIAIKDDGTPKIKGRYANPWADPKLALFRMHKNPTNTICTEAVFAQLADGVPVQKTISECTDVRKFVTVRKVNGGAVKVWEDGSNEYLGQSIRWYYAKGQAGKIVYAENGKKVAKSDGAKPLMLLPDKVPEDIDLERYVKEANKILKEVAYA